MTENEISHIIIACAIEVHRTLGGPGLLESVYEEALVWELEQRGLKVKRQVDFPIPYKGRTLSKHLRMDVLVQDLVLVDTKAATMTSLKLRCTSERNRSRMGSIVVNGL